MPLLGRSLVHNIHYSQSKSILTHDSCWATQVDESGQLGICRLQGPNLNDGWELGRRGSVANGCVAVMLALPVRFRPGKRKIDYSDQRRDQKTIISSSTAACSCRAVRPVHSLLQSRSRSRWDGSPVTSPAPNCVCGRGGTTTAARRR